MTSTKTWLFCFDCNMHCDQDLIYYASNLLLVLVYLFIWVSGVLLSWDWTMEVIAFLVCCKIVCYSFVTVYLCWIHVSL